MVGQGPENCGSMRRGRPGCLLCRVLSCGLHCPPSLSSCRSVDHQKNLVELSFLPSDTGKSDVFSASPGLSPLKQGEKQIEVEERDHKGKEEKEKKENQKRKKNRNQKGQEEAQLPSKEKKEPQKPHAEKQGKRPHLESASEQVRPQGAGPPHV